MSYVIMSRMKRLTVALLAAMVLAGSAFPVTPGEAAAKLEKRLRALRTFQARFDQYYYSAAVSEPLHERGEIFLQKPDLMRWEYKDPQEKVFLYKGGRLEVYVAEENQLTRSRVSPDAYESDIVGVFLGTHSFADVYTIEDAQIPMEVPGVRQVKLTPKVEGDYSSLVFEIEERTGLLRRAVFYEWAGNRREFVFSKMRVDAALPARTFELKVPPGTEVIDDEGVIKH
jgi:outer membrane lipoprotein carrier protein